MGSSGTSSGAESGSGTATKHENKFAGASANDAFADVAHAGFEIGSEGRFGYSRKYAAGWERIFGNKTKVTTTPDVAVSTVDDSGPTGLAKAVAQDTILPNNFKDQLTKLN